MSTRVSPIRTRAPGGVRIGEAGAATLWTAWVTCAASAKAIVGAGALFVPAPGDRSILTVVFFLVVAVFTSAGLYLVLMGRRDRRAVPLGVFFILVASAFSERLLEGVAAGMPALAPLALALRKIPVDAYLAFFFWAFIRDFPRRSTPGRGAAGMMLAVAFCAGTLLLVGNLVPRFTNPELAGAAWARLVDAEGALYWTVVFGLILPGLGYAVARARSASPSERRRVRILLAGLVVGFGPSLAVVLLTSIPVLDRLLDRDDVFRVVGVVVYPTLLSIPFSTAYAVLAHDALDVRLVVRRALQYALARSTLIGVVALPFAVVVALVYTRRDERVADLVSGSTGLLLAGVLTIGGAALLLRIPLMDLLDRSFFREQYDGRVVLAALVERTREIRDARELAALLAREIDRALHLRHVHTLLLDPEDGVLKAPGDGPPPLSISTPLARHLEATGVPLDADPGRPAPWLRALPREAWSWLDGAGARLVLPVSAADGSLLGVVVLGEKRSELPFTHEDRQLLATIGSSVALWLEHRLLARFLPGAMEAPRPARECAVCASVSPADAERCPRCGEATRVASVPLVLAGKFRFVERLGVGGMGVVYRAVDLALDREVAVKTLPRMNPREARALRREARVMAAVSHPGLALIFGAESWAGAPLLVVEYLPGGTLADRLARGPLPAREAVEVAAALVPALERLHAAGVLHRDIKPSNIGFAADGSVKLLDFGVSRVMEAARQEEPRARRRFPDAPSVSVGGGTQDGAGWMGTPLYLSPEAVRGDAPDAGHDLWALCMVIYESVLGRHPLDDGAPHRLLLRLYDAEIPDPREHPGLCPALGSFLREALHPHRARRPSSARELGARLAELREVL